MANRASYVVSLVIALFISNASLAADPDGRQIKADTDFVLLHFAKSGEAVPYEQLTNIVSAAYSKEFDAFKKRDMVEKSKPMIDKLLSEFKVASHFYFDVSSAGQPMRPYDFNRKGFDLYKPGNSKCISGYGVGMRICYTFKDSPRFSFVSVTDVEKAKQLESMRATYSFGNSRVYFKIVAFDESIRALGRQPLAEITKIVVMNKVGSEIYSIQ